MSNPERPAVASIIPDGIRQRITEADLIAAEDPDRLGESLAEARDRRERAAASRRRMWLDRVPSRFRGAALDGLTAQQDPAGAVSGWWASESPTLVLLSASPGVGKTHTAYAVGNAAVAGGTWALGWYVPDFNDAIRPGHDSTAYVVAQECDLLLLDDLGREKITEWTLERLQGVLDARWRNGLRTIVTTNLSGQEFLDRYGDPIVDRVQDGARIVQVTGQSRRRPAPW